MMIRYSELILLDSFEDRFKYLMLSGKVSEKTFGGHRYLNQMLYRSSDWKKVRRRVIIRDNGFDLAHEDYPIKYDIYVHHLNPITMEDIMERRSCVFDMENLISCSFDTHNAIHYGNIDFLKKTELVVRTINDTCLWR